MSNFSVNNPSTGQTEDTFTRIEDADRDAILDRSTAAYRQWRTTTVDERAAVLNRAADLYEEKKDELASYIGREMGKLDGWAKAELDIVIDIYRYYAEHAHELLADKQLPAQGARHTYVRKDPIGPLLGIMPWNFPYYQVARWAAPNLLLGNSLVLKHASICPLSSQACQDILEDAGLPQDVFQNVYASGSQMDAFVADPRIAAVSLTGSEGAGAAVARTAGENYKKSLLELGGNDPFIVLDDDNLDTVLDQYVGIRMYNTGQACNAPKRLIVMDGFYDRVVEGLEKRIGALTVGAWDDPDADVGPLSSIDARDEIVQRLADAKANDVDEAVEIANNSDYGLSGSVWGSDLALAEDAAARLEVGMSFVNEASVTAAGLPFGGVGRSGYGRELAEWGVGEFVNEHLVRVSPLT
ncbi:MAG: aldehyde dehydrogenase family protein [Corynebacterium sp.]|nr:aldehyde dehydrogenase family protein [Corynebacterium sp.]